VTWIQAPGGPVTLLAVVAFSAIALPASVNMM
jgi:hypothetical protein